MGYLRDIIDDGEDSITKIASEIISHSDFKEEIRQAAFNGESSAEFCLDGMIETQLSESQFIAVIKKMTQNLSNENVTLDDYEYDVTCSTDGSNERVSGVRIELEW
jgi:hypothetical protein